MIMRQRTIEVATLGNGDDLGTEYAPFSWMVEPRSSLSMVSSGGPWRYYIDGDEVVETEYRAVRDAQDESTRVARCEKEFTSATDAFEYAAALQDGIVLDRGYYYVAMERDGLKIGFVIEPWEQPIVTPGDLLARPGPCFILARCGVRRDWIGGCSTNFTDDSQSWSEDEVEVIEDGAGHYQAGQHLLVRVSPNMGARASIGQNWRMKLLRPEDVMTVITTQATASASAQ